MCTLKIKLIRDIILSFIFIRNSPKGSLDVEKYKQVHYTNLKVTLFAIVILPYFLQL